mmetsp:Transcript_43759/g.70064  ORF Transcript_43759/g.70064 Transcript_43759/m.70064 type:complete len:446 (+) Transcript_43759:474-1811(+)
MPYKEKFLRQLLDDKEKEKNHEKERLKKLRQMKREQEEQMEDAYDDENAVEEGNKKRKRKLVEDLANTAERTAAFEEKQAQLENQEDSAPGANKGKKRMYMKELRNVVDTADVVLLVLDARDPMGCRAPQAEKMVLENTRSKRLVCVLNKIDLIPKSVAEQWLTELRKEFPTVAFRASTQEQRSNLARASKDAVGLGAGSGDSTIGDGVCVGADTLVQLLKNYSRNKGIKTSITVGVVGYPNVGKSSIINSLKRSRAVSVSPTPGHTKALQIVQLDKKVKLIDSPGVLFQDSTQNKTSSRLILRNCLNPADIEDAIQPVTALLAQCNNEQLMFLYKIARFETPTEFLVAVAQKRGKLGKGGIPDQQAAARLILQDWNAGKIPYYVLPPKTKRADKKVTSKVVTEWSKEFDLDALMKKEQSELVERLPGSIDPDDFAVVFKDSMNL